MKTLMEWGLVSKGDTLVIDNMVIPTRRYWTMQQLSTRTNTITFNEWGSNNRVVCYMHLRLGKEEGRYRNPG